MGHMDSPQRATSQSLERGLEILASFNQRQRLLGVSELARALGLTRSTTHRYVVTLSGLGYLDQDSATKKYRLGPRVLDLGFSALNSMELRETAAPHLQQLSDETGFTANMAILDDTDVVYVERCRTSRPGQREIDLDIHVGSRLPVYCTAMGKALLAFQPDDERLHIIDQVDLRERGPNTITDRDTLVAELDNIRRLGIAVNNEELAYGLRSIAAPILASSGNAVAAINLAVHRTMISIGDLLVRYSPAVKRTAHEISVRVGYRVGS
jgi:IclR family pca regulon transcriptional regulator